MSGKLAQVATFVVGTVVGAAMVYLSPPPQGAGGAEGPMGPPLAGEQGGMPMEGGPPPADMMGGGPGAGPPMAGGTPTDSVPQPGAEGGPGEVPGGPPPTDGAEGPPPGEGAGPEGPPPGEVGGPGAPPASGNGAWLEDHLGQAKSLWTSQASAARSAGQEDLAVAMDALANSAPEVGDRPPPLDRVVVFLSDERVLVDRMKAAGLDTSAVEAQIGPVLH